MLKNLVLVRGSGGCGTTTFASALAAHLARDGVQTLLISPDTRIPAFGLWAPGISPKDPAVSLGQVLAERLTRETLAEKIYLPGHLKENVGLLGYLSKEPYDQYSPPDGETAQTLLSMLCSLSALVLVDGARYGDAITAEAARLASLQIHLLETDPRGILSYTSTPPENPEGKTVWFSFSRSAEDPVETVADRLRLTFAGSIPFIEEAHTKLAEGRLFEPYASRLYREALEVAAREAKGAAL